MIPSVRKEKAELPFTEWEWAGGKRKDITFLKNRKL